MKVAHINLICLGITLLSACGKKGDDPRTLPVDPFLTAPLRKELELIQKDAWAESCDSTWSNIKTELVNAVVEKEDSLKGEASLQQLPAQHAIKFAGSYLRNPPYEAPTTTEWTSYSYSWKSAYEFLKRNQKDPYLGFWKDLNAQVRSLLLEDKKRVVWGSNVGIDQTIAPHIEAFYAAIEKCVSSSCIMLDFPADKLEIMKKAPYYAHRLSKWEKELDLPKKQELLGNLQTRVKNDLPQVTETINPKLELSTDSNGKHFRLGIDANEFATEDKKLMKETIESVWKMTGIDFQLSFELSEIDSSLYKILFHQNRPGQRYNVQWNNKTMNLYPLGTVRPIAHEFGHVLGLKDKYYTTWNSRKCEYTDHYNVSDLMSDSDSGLVTLDAWKKLLNGVTKPAS